jgi:hypothetical protein
MSSTISNTNVSAQSIKDCMLPLATIVGAGAGSGIIAGLVGIVNPIGGILFGVTAAAITNVVLPVLGFLCNRDKNPAMNNLLGCMMIPLHCVGAAAAAAALVTATGFPIGFFGAGMLGIASLVSMFVAGQLASVRL